METVKNKVAVVTGAGSGIGEAIAREAAARGMSVVVADIDEALMDAFCAGHRNVLFPQFFKYRRSHLPANTRRAIQPNCQSRKK